MPNIQTYYFEIHLKCCHLLWRLVELLKKGQKNLFWPWLQLKEGSESRSIRSGFSRTFFVLTFVTFISSLETPTDFKFVTRKQFIAFVLENHVGGFLTLLENWLRFHEIFFATWWSLGVVLHLVWKSWRDSLFHQCWSMWWFEIFEHTQRR